MSKIPPVHPATAEEMYTTTAPVILTPELCKALLYKCEEIITDVCEECGYDQTNIKPINWMYILVRIREQIFDKHPNLLGQYNNTHNSYTGYIFNLDNIEMIYKYIYYKLCSKYSQIVSRHALCKMLGIDNTNPIRWDERGVVTSNGISFRKMVNADRETMLQNAMLSSSQNPVKFLAIGNHEFGWAESREERIEESRPVISLDDVPDVPEVESSDNLALPFTPDEGE